ncbi:MAG TPA: hypothetical protein VLX44_00380 [Xanthobacteraceae bacterium]|nr:hypothetical protein [Xanthobacteraceae bacterium]
MPDIVRADFAKECVRQSLSCGANPHYLLGVAQLRSAITNRNVGGEVGPFGLTQAVWNQHCTDAPFELDFLPADINDSDSQIAVFAVMAREAFDAFAVANNRNPSAKELYLQQFPTAASATLSADLKTALDATAALVGPAADAVLDDPQAAPPQITNPDQQTGSGQFNQKFNTFFTSLIGGFFSADPDSSKPRSIRTNNPGAMDVTDWQKTRVGFVGNTPDDGHGNKTTIYSAPEYGIAAWYFLLANRYGFGDGSFTIGDLARKYAGPGAPQSNVDNYVSAWTTFSNPQLSAASVVQMTDDGQMLNLARALFTNESGRPMPFADQQILFGIQHERNKTLPSPPAPPAVQVAARGSGAAGG